MSDRILIVDDQPANLDILSQELEDRGYAIDTASNGKAALATLESSRPDLIILDYMMPGLSGLDVLKKVREWGNGIPVVIITAHGTVDRAVQAMKEGAYDFVTRPVDPEHLVLVVRKALERQTLERGVKILSEEVDERYRLVVGENSQMNSISVDIRIIAATNRDLRAQVRDGLFREDLYHRLHVFPITLPPLRERKEDIPALTRYFLQKYSREARKESHEMTTEAAEKLIGYDWPGNVRELANVIERAVILASGPTITVAELPEIVQHRAMAARSEDVTLFEATTAFRKEMIETALVRANGNRAQAARALGLDRKYLGKLLKSLDIELP